MLTGAGSDLWYVTHVRARSELAATGNAVVVGVGFDDAHWETARSIVRRAAGLAADFEVDATGRLADDARWDVWTHHYV